MKTASRIVTSAVAILMACGLGAPAFSQANDADGYGDGYQSGAYGRVRAADGGVGIVRADGERGDTEAAGVNAPIFPGDAVRTNRDQRVEIQLAGGSIVRIDRGAEVVFQSLPNPSASYQDNTVVALDAGVLRIASRLGEKEEFRIDTRDASIYLLGEGEFRIDAGDRGGTRVTSIRGVAEVVGNDASVLVRGGTRTVARSGAAPEAPTAASAFASDGFDRWCAAREDAYRAHDGYADRGDDQRDNVPEEVRPYYAELSLSGSWSSVPDYGTVWSPTGVASGWRPYADGSWSYGPGGYFWVSSEPWGWAPYHYGTWQWIPGHGWCWIPGHVFAGAWVSWSWGSLYVGWAPLDYWGRPGWIGGPYYNGYYDPGCWTFVNYDHIHAGNVHRYAVPLDTVRDDLARATVVARAPRVDPRRIAESWAWREHALRQVADDHAARMRPLQSGGHPDRRLADVEDHLLRRPPQATPAPRGAQDAAAAPGIDRRTTATRQRRILEDPIAGSRRDVRPEAQDSVRDLYQRMSRPRETRSQQPQAPAAETPSYLRPPSLRTPATVRTEAPRGQPRAEAPRVEPPRVQGPRVQAPQPPAPRQAAPSPHASPEAKPRHGDKK